MDKFQQVLPLVLAHEGGYVNHPKDPGGATNRGVTQATYNAYRRNRGRAVQSVARITDAEVHEIYRQQYWDAVRGDDLPAGVCYAAFDYGVNSGPSRSIKDLQRTLNARWEHYGLRRTLDVDGSPGDMTLEAIRAAANVDEEGLIEEFCNRRMRFLRSLSTFKTFGRGWTRRVMGNHDGFQAEDNGVIDYAIMMARDDLEFPVRPANLPAAVGERTGEVAGGKASEADVSPVRNTAGVGAAAAGAGAAGNTIIAAGQQVSPHIGDSILGKIALGVFIVLMLVGAGLVAYNFYRRMKDSGAI